MTGHLKLVDMPSRGLPQSFLSGIRQGSWFVAVGTPLNPDETGDALAFAQGLGLDASAVRTVRDWREIAGITRDSSLDQTWWEAEEAAYRSLKADLSASAGDAAALVSLSEVANLAGEVTMSAALAALAREGVADAGLARVASGAASMACHHAATAKLAAAPEDHPFYAKLGLFQAGRMLVGIHDGQVWVA